MSIQPVQVAKTRRGRFGALLALAAMVVAMGAWWTSASALPTTVITWQGPVANATVTVPYQVVVYQATATLTGGASTGATNFSMTLPAGAIDITPNGATSGSLTCPAFTAGSTTTTTTVTCTGANLAAGAHVMALNVRLSGTTATWAAPTATISDTVNSVGPVTGNAVTNGAPLSSVVSQNGTATATNAIGVPETFVFTLAPNTTCASDADASDTDTDRDCVAADVALTGGLVLVSGPTVATPNVLANNGTVTVVVAGNTTGTVALLLKGPQGIQGAPAQPFTSAVGTKNYGPAELRHMADPVCTTANNGANTGVTVTCGNADVVTGSSGAVGAGILASAQDVVNNVRGSRHVVCTVAANTGVTGVAAVPVDIPLTLPNTQITIDNGGGYNGPQPVPPQIPTFTDVQVFTGNGTNGGLNGATCFSWVSVGAGDQQINVTYVGFDGVSRNVNWDTDNTGNGEGAAAAARPNKSLIKEWNVLENSTISVNGVDQVGAAPAVTTTVAALAGFINTASSFAVTNAAGITVGSAVIVGGDGVVRTVLAVTPVAGGTVITITPALAAAPAAGVTISIPVAVSGPLQTVTVSRPLFLDPGTGLYRIIGTSNATATSQIITIGDRFNGSHVTRSGSVFSGPLAGVNWTVGLAAGSCGELQIPLPSTMNFAIVGANFTMTPTLLTLLPGTTITGTTTLLTTGAVGNNPVVNFHPGTTLARNCQPTSTATINFTGSEPSPIGSGTGLTVNETVIITFSQSIAAKKVLLAWAGQRIVLENDWRIPPGDLPNGTNVGTCPLPGVRIDYIKGTGPGNFLQGLGAYNVTDSTASVTLQDINNAAALDSQIADIPTWPQGACISRVLYESEDPGEVDIEAFMVAGGGNANVGINDTKVAFVVYYMKLNRVNVSLVTQVSKPSHNSSSGTPTGIVLSTGTTGPVYLGNTGIAVLGNDYAPGNPWDATKDAKDNTADWNVSRDLLVRGRVTGWFVNANPSGRERDVTDPLNVLPQDRWVMPDDWALLAGGPKDDPTDKDVIGTAEQFRPYYDLMFAPQNARGIALQRPEGSDFFVVAATIATPTNGFTNAGSALVPAVGVPYAPVRNAQNLLTTFVIASNRNVPAGACLQVGGVGTGFGPEYIQVASTNYLLNSSGNIIGYIVTISQAPTTCTTQTGSVIVPATGLSATPAANIPVALVTVSPFEGPYSLLDLRIGGGGVSTTTGSLGGVTTTFGSSGAAASNIFGGTSATRDTVLPDGDVDMWDAPMPPAMVSVRIRGTGFIKQVIKSDVYYLGTPNTNPNGLNGGTQTYPNAFYISNIPDSPFIPPVVVGGGYLWDSWANDGPAALGGIWSSVSNGALGQGPYRFWTPILSRLNAALTAGTNSEGVSDSSIQVPDQVNEIIAIRNAYGDPTIARDLVVYSDNHGEFMVTANGDFNIDTTACASNVLGGGKHCKPGDKVGVGQVSAVADYPDFRGKHFPVASNVATINWTWGGYKDVTIENGEDPQFKYVVFHAMDRDGFCHPDPTSLGQVSLHPVLSTPPIAPPLAWPASNIVAPGTVPNDTFPTGHNGDPLVGPNNPSETIDFLIDSGEGIILNTSGSVAVGTGIGTNDGRQFANGVRTFSTLSNDPSLTGIKEFPLSPLAASGATDECQAWIRVSNSLLGILNVLVIAHDDIGARSDRKDTEGNIGFDKVIDLQNTATFTLNFRWTLVTWTGADAVPVKDALGGTGANDAGNDISGDVTAVYGWDAAAQDWLAYFPTGVNVPGANDLVSLKNGAAYWIAIKGPSSVSWTIATNVGR